MRGQKRTAEEIITTARSRGFAGEGNVYRRSNASVGGERCNVLQVAEGVWRAESGPGEAIEGVGG